MAKNAKGDTIANGPEHDLAVTRYMLRRGRNARRMRAQGPEGRRELDRQLIIVLTNYEPSPFDAELKELIAAQQAVTAA